jgi:effector-binding domain-containing protein
MSATQLKPMPTVGHSPRRLLVYTHHVVSHEVLGTTIGKAFDLLYSFINEAGLQPSGPPFVIYNTESEPGVRWDMDVCAPIATPVTPRADIKFREMPEERVVSLMHFGPYETLGEAYTAINEFLNEHGHVASGPPREIYYSEPDVPPEQVQTLIEQPIF